MNIFKLSCDSRFQRAFTAFSCAFKVITLVGSNQGTYFVNATACSKRTLKTTVKTLFSRFFHPYPFAKKSQSKNVTRGKLRKALSYENSRKNVNEIDNRACV